MKLLESQRKLLYLDYENIIIIFFSVTDESCTVTPESFIKKVHRIGFDFKNVLDVISSNSASKILSSPLYPSPSL